MPEASEPATHVFIVGLPRTGSTLTHRILNRSPQARLAGETHYLGTRRRLDGRKGYRERFLAAGDLRTNEGLERVVDAIYASRGKSFWSRFAATVGRDEFTALLRQAERTDRGLFDAALRAFAHGRPVAGDKSPEHIHAIPRLMTWFPRARVVHTFRDPRAIYVSLRRKERDERLSLAGRLARRAGPLFELYATTSLALRWRHMARLHRQYSARYGDRYLLQRFEDMLADPEATTRRLCQFIGISYDPAMLDQTVHNSSYAPKQSGAGIDRSAGERWREHLPRLTERWLWRLCGADMAAFGYER
jgi:hypothetical protein